MLIDRLLLDSIRSSSISQNAFFALSICPRRAYVWGKALNSARSFSKPFFLHNDDILSTNKTQQPPNLASINLQLVLI